MDSNVVLMIIMMNLMVDEKGLFRSEPLLLSHKSAGE